MFMLLKLKNDFIQVEEEANILFCILFIWNGAIYSNNCQFSLNKTFRKKKRNKIVNYVKVSTFSVFFY